MLVNDILTVWLLLLETCNPVLKTSNIFFCQTAFPFHSIALGLCEAEDHRGGYSLQGSQQLYPGKVEEVNRPRT